MAAKKANLAAELAARLVSALEQQRHEGAYPLPLSDLAALADPGASPELVLAAAARKPFTERVAVARKKDLVAPVALRDDVARLTDSPLLLTFALTAACTPESPACALDRVATKAKLDATVKAPFTEALRRHVEAGTLPPEVVAVVIKNKTHLHWRHLPPPPPPRKPEVVLAETLLQALESAKQSGDGAYPTTLRALLDAAGADAAVAKKALGQAAFKNGVVLAVKGHPDTPLALADDADALAGSGLVLEFLLRAARSEATQAFTTAELKKKLVPGLRGPFAEEVERRARARDLPPEVGWLPLKKNMLLFFVADVRRARALPPLLPAAREAVAPPDGAAAFDTAFAHLDAARGGYNFVSLVDLRRALGLPRHDFDELVRRLRAEGRYTLSAAEGRHGLGPEEREAGLLEDGVLLLYVSRRSS